MTSTEILEKVWAGDDGTDANQFWLQEIAYQLAVMNERNQTEHSANQTVQAASRNINIGFDGFEPPVTGDSEHIFHRIEGNRFCGKCGAGEFHAIHTRMSVSVPSRTPEPAGQDSNPSREVYPFPLLMKNDVDWLHAQLRARDLARKTDREQNG